MQQINPEKAREEFRSASQANGGTGVKDFMDGMGLGMLVEQVTCCCALSSGVSFIVSDTNLLVILNDSLQFLY